MPAAMLLLPLLGLAAAAVPERWDLDIQGSAWRRRQHANLEAQQERGATGPLLPCSVPPVTAPLPEGPLPAELESMLADLRKDLETMFVQSGATGGSVPLVCSGALSRICDGWPNHSRGELRKS